MPHAKGFRRVTDPYKPDTIHQIRVIARLTNALPSTSSALPGGIQVPKVDGLPK